MRLFVLAGLLILPTALPAFAEENVPMSGFTLSRSRRSPGGLGENWALEVTPDGHARWQGSHRPRSPLDCSSDAGTFEIQLGAGPHQKLVAAAVEAREEQDSLKKPLRESGRRFESLLRLSTEQAGEVRSLHVRDQTLPKTRAFLNETDKLMEQVFRAPLRAVAIRSRRGTAGTIELDLTNTGTSPMRLVLPDHAADAFGLERPDSPGAAEEDARIGLSYVSKPAKRELELGAKQTISLRFKKVEIPKDAVLVFDNAPVLHHAELRRYPGAPPAHLRICTRPEADG